MKLRHRLEVWCQTYQRPLSLALSHTVFHSIQREQCINHKPESAKKHLIDNRLQRRVVTLAVLYLKWLCVHELGPTFMPKVITVINILKIRARASCHTAVYRPSPAGRSAKLLPVLVSDMFVGCKVRHREAKKNKIKKKSKFNKNKRGGVRKWQKINSKLLYRLKAFFLITITTLKSEVLKTMFNICLLWGKLLLNLILITWITCATLFPWPTHIRIQPWHVAQTNLLIHTKKRPLTCL